jgi:hypothetical protein
MAWPGERRNKRCVLTKYQPVFLPVEPNWSWDERTTRTFLMVILMEIEFFFSIQLFNVSANFVSID